MLDKGKIVLLFIPIVQDREQLNDLIARSAWHFSYSMVDKIVLLVSDEKLMKHEVYVSHKFDPTIENLVKRFDEKIEFKIIKSKKDLVSTVENADIILQWNKDLPFDLSAVEFEKQKKGKKFWHVDPTNTRLEGSYYIEAALSSFGDKKTFIDESKVKFSRLGKKVKGKTIANILATGPSVGNYKEFSFDNSINVLCNTLILDDILMKAVNPDILVFADPIFHFGVSRYAYNFRTALLKAIKNYEFYIVVPLKYYPLTLSFLPHYHNRIIGLPYDKDYNLNLDLSKDFYLKGTSNILTFLMIPLAVTFAQNINLLGCDGRLLCNDYYFWSHNNKTQQQGSELANIQEVHPGFFKTDYNEYYLEHCISLEKYFQEGEKKGCQFNSLAPSYIPAIRSRQKQEIREPNSEKLPEDVTGRVLIIDPDGESKIGHYLAFNDNMQKALEEIGAKVDILCRKNIDPAILEKRKNYIPALSISSYYVSVDKDKHSYIPQAYQELETILNSYIQKYEDELITIYMYVGSFEHFEMIYRIVNNEKNVRIVINLYRLSFIDLNREYFSAWNDLIMKCISSQGRFVLTVPTKELQEEVCNLTSFSIPIASHPSTTFSDDEFPTLYVKAELRNNINDKLKVLFLGLPRFEKGYEATLQAVRYLNRFPKEYSCSVRHVNWRGTPKDFKTVPNDIIEKCNLISGSLDLKNFKKIFLEHDVIVLPYNPSSFKNRTSGLLIDSLYAGLPVVAVKDTWLGRKIKEYECGIVVDDINPELLCHALSQIKSNYEHYVKKALQASVSYFCNNNWSILARSILPIASNQKFSSMKIENEKIVIPKNNYRDKQKRKMLILIGNGPSTAELAKFGFHNIPDHVDTFGMVGAYRYFERINWWPTYYGLADKKVVYHHRHKLKQLVEDEDITTKKFYLSWEISDSPKVEVIGHSSTGSFCLRKAIDLGYNEIYLLGMEGVYVEEIAQSRPLSEREIEEYGFNKLNLAPKEKKLRIITATPSHNPNYFFNDYQQEGDIYSLPQSHTHQKNWSDVAEEAQAKGVKVYNLSAMSKIEEFEKMDFEVFLRRIISNYEPSILIAENYSKDIMHKKSISDEKAQHNLNDLPINQFLESKNSLLIGPYERIYQSNLNEANCIASIFSSLLEGSVMIDVGAFHGASLMPFLKKDWRIFAFEPDEKNRQFLKEKLQQKDNASMVYIDSRAVSNKISNQVNFYRSRESAGISALSPFHSSHRAVQQVETVTLKEALKSHDIQAVDYLKIDSEGHDLFVLQGFPWERFKPAVIECEFENAKTLPLGYSWQDLAEYLYRRDYSVYVSEWHPIIVYGIKHDWRQLSRYPCTLNSTNAWGNLLAFRDPINQDQLLEIVRMFLETTPLVHNLKMGQ